MRIEWSPQARDDLLEIYRYVAKDNVRAARTLHEKILSSVLSLTTTPHLGRPGRVAETRELIISGTPYIVPYRVHDKVLQILRVYHCARRWPESFE